MELSEAAVITTAAADTYEKLVGSWADGDCCKFAVDPSGTMTYSGTSGRAFLFNGSSDLRVDQADLVHYALYKNGALVPRAETPHTFTAPAKTSNISITAIITLDAGDEIEVWVKSATEGTEITVETLRITLWGAQ